MFMTKYMIEYNFFKNVRTVDTKRGVKEKYLHVLALACRLTADPQVCSAFSKRILSPHIVASSLEPLRNNSFCKGNFVFYSLF
jgi:hypothetical protein